jgi:hypothetical protein
MSINWKEQFTVGNVIAIVAATVACATAFGTQAAKIGDLERRVIALEKKVEAPAATVDPILAKCIELSGSLASPGITNSPSYIRDAMDGMKCSERFGISPNDPKF